MPATGCTYALICLELVSYLSFCLRYFTLMKCNQFKSRFCNLDCDLLRLPQYSQTAIDINNIVQISELIQNISTCKYYDPDHHLFVFRPKNSLFVLHINIRSINNNYSSVLELLQIYSCPPELICISETWLNQDLITNINILEYEMFLLYREQLELQYMSQRGITSMSPMNSILIAMIAKTFGLTFTILITKQNMKLGLSIYIPQADRNISLTHSAYQQNINTQKNFLFSWGFKH